MSIFCRIVYLLVLTTAAVVARRAVDDWKKRCHCDENYSYPQCASDGKTYINPCMLECRRDYLKGKGKTIETVHFGDCDASNTNPDENNHNDGSESDYWNESWCHYCDKKHSDPQCASDGKTYNNICILECRRDYLQGKGKTIETVHSGDCDASSINTGENNHNNGLESDDWNESWCHYCDENYSDPQCASDGKTYLSICILECRRDYLQGKGKTIETVHSGECDG